METVWSFLKKLIIELPYDPAIPLLSMYPKELKAGSQRNICTPIYTAAALFTTAKKQKQHKDLSMDEKTKKLTNMVYTYNGMLVSLKKEKNSDTCYSVDEP